MDYTVTTGNEAVAGCWPTLAPKRPAGAQYYPAAFDPADAARLRRELIEYNRSALGLRMAAAVCAIGRATLLPDVAGVHRQATALCAGEIERLTNATLWYATSETLELTAAAYPDYPVGPYAEGDLPSESGLVVFQTPLLSREVEDAEADAAASAMGFTHLPGPDVAAPEDPVYICAASWGPFAPANWEGVGHWVTFYASRGSSLRWWGEEWASQAAHYPQIVPEHDLALRAPPDPLPPGQSPADYHLRPGVGTASWVRMLLCAFAMMRQEHLVDQTATRIAREERKRHKRAGLAEPKEIRVLSVHRSAGAQEALHASAALVAGQAHYKHRFVVRGHWRKQPYRSTGEVRLRYIAPYWKGPADAPLLLGQKIIKF